MTPVVDRGDEESRQFPDGTEIEERGYNPPPVAKVDRPPPSQPAPTPGGGREPAPKQPA